MHVHLLQAQVSSTGMAKLEENDALDVWRAFLTAHPHVTRAISRDLAEAGPPGPRRGGAAGRELVRPPVGAVPAARAPAAHQRARARGGAQPDGDEPLRRPRRGGRLRPPRAGPGRPPRAAGRDHRRGGHAAAADVAGLPGRDRALLRRAPGQFRRSHEGHARADGRLGAVTLGKHCEVIYNRNVTATTPTAAADRSDAVDAVATALVPAASRVTRLLLRRAPQGVSRSEAGVLSALSRGPRRITELADLEGHAQPTMALLVKRLEQRGWVARDRDPADGRVVLVSLTTVGTAALEDVRAAYRRVLRDHLVALTDDQLAALQIATEALESLLDALQQGDSE